ncbi:MAG: Imm10 family immunity protein [Methylophilaceae bacterium]
MPTGFVATELSVVLEDGVLVTALGASSSDDGGFYLMFQHQDQYDAQDVELGMNQPYIEYCGQAWSWYGHILGVTLHSHRVVVLLDDEAASHMQNDGLLEVQFSFHASQFQTLTSALQRTFAGYAYYREVA